MPLPGGPIKLVKPNAPSGRNYYTARERHRGPFTLLVVQCRDPIDMSGHYPPNCYPNNGQPIVSSAPRTWTVPGVPQPVRGTEYHFEAGSLHQPARRVVYNFFVLPGKGVVPDMAEVREASGNHQRRHYGSAQIQVVFDENPSEADPAWRDQVFATLIASKPGVLQVLNPGGI